MAQAYEHTQKGHRLMIFGLLAGIFVMSGLYYNILDQAPMRNQAETTANCILTASGLLAGLILVWAAAMMSALTIVIEEDFIRIRFGPGAWKKKFALEKVVSARPVKSSFWHGWGIHYTGKAWLYNIAGFDAVEITLKNGKKNWLGTDEPEKLTSAINREIGQVS